MRAAFESLRTDLRHALRLFRRAPFSTASMLLVLAFGLGLHIAVFAFYRTFFLAPVPGVQAPDRLAVIAGLGSLGEGWLPISYFDYRRLAGASQTLSPIAAYLDVSVSVPLGGLPDHVVGEMVTPEFFDVLGVHARLGRTLRPEDESGNPYVVVLSSHLWQTGFGGDPRAVGGKLLINQRPFTIVGVIDRRFVGVEGLSAPRFWIPLAAYRAAFPEPDLFFKRDSRTLLLVARLQRNATFQQARMEIDALARRLEQESPAEGKREMVLAPLTSRIAADRGASLRRSTALLFLLSAAFLLISCGNVTNLLLAKGLARQQETRIRHQLGASRGLLARQFLTESFALSLPGGLLALLVAACLLKILIALRPSFLPGLAQESLVGAKEWVFAMVATLGAGVLFGLAPAIQSCTRRFLSHHEPAGLWSSVSHGALLRGRCLIAFQSFLCTVSLACAGFFVISLLSLERVDPGFERRDLLLVSIDLKSAGYGESEVRQVQQDLLQTLRRSPGVRLAALASDRPFGGFSIWRDVSVTRTASRTERTLVASEIVSPDYFRCVGIPILRGRSLDPEDHEGFSPSVVINETMGRVFWPGGDPLGRFLYLDGETLPVEVVGIARDAQYIRLGEASIPVMYLASSQRYLSRGFLHIRFARNQRDAVAAVRDSLIRQSRVRPGEIQTISQVIERSLWLPRLEATLASVLSLFALALAVTGTGGIIALFAQQRRRDFSIRAALGATSGRIIRDAVARELAAAGGGAVVGVATAWLINSRLADVLFAAEQSRLPIVFSAAAMTLAVVLLSAAFPVARLTGSERVLWLRM
jgi:predicted permease